MKSLILYGSPTKLTNGHKLVSQNKQAKYYVRADQFNGSLDEALDKARPQPGETVLNTVEVEVL